MITDSIEKQRKQRQPNAQKGNQTPSYLMDKPVSVERFRSVLAFIDGAPVSNVVIPYAESLADTLHADLQLLTVLEPDHETDEQFDPVEWSLRRREAKIYLERLVSEYRLDTARTSIEILEGKSADAIGNCLSHSKREITVFCRKDDQELGHIGSTSRTVLERCTGSIFLVPARAATPNGVRFQRILVPLDGSPRAESVLPTISSMAQSCDATVVVVHASPHTEVIEMMPGDSKSAQLNSELEEHNQFVAKQYLERIGRRLRESGVRVELRVLESGDTRRQLVDAIGSESIDLVVLSSHGASGHADVPFGDVANYVMSRSPVPALMLRGTTLSGTATVMDRLADSGGRAPEGANQP